VAWLARIGTGLGEKGFNDAQMTEIAACAEISRATLHALFEGKDELYAEVIASAVWGVRDRVQSQVEEIEDPGEQLLCVIDALFACFKRARICCASTCAAPTAFRFASAGSWATSRSTSFVSVPIHVAQPRHRICRGVVRGCSPDS